MTTPPAVGLGCTVCGDSSVRENNRFEALAPLKCSECDIRQTIGEVMYGCDVCMRRLCSQCHLTAEVDDDMIMLTMMQLGTGSVASSPRSRLGAAAPSAAKGGSQSRPMATTADLAGLAAHAPAVTARRAAPRPAETSGEEHHSDGESRSPSAGRSHLEPSRQSLGPPQLGSPRHADSRSGSGERVKTREQKTDKADRPALVKQCSMCDVSYHGFGGSCPTCRSKGPSGAARQCQRCNTFFHGFGDTCTECRGKLAAMVRPSIPIPKS